MKVIRRNKEQPMSLIKSAALITLIACIPISIFAQMNAREQEKGPSCDGVEQMTVVNKFVKGKHYYFYTYRGKEIGAIEKMANIRYPSCLQALEYHRKYNAEGLRNAKGRWIPGPVCGCCAVGHPGISNGLMCTFCGSVKNCLP